MTPAELLETMAGLLRRVPLEREEPATVFSAAGSGAGVQAAVERPSRPPVPPDPEAVRAMLERAGHLHARLNLFTTLLRDGLPPTGDGPLTGRPAAVKDLFDVAGVTTIAGSKLFSGRPPATADATAVRRLRAAGGRLIGCTNMDEFAYGFSTENSHYGPTRNPHDRNRIAGGSSGGSAAAVASGAVDVALGTDTNGSVRVPAALCGVFGLRPTYGRVPRTGTVGFSSSFDVVGPLARDVRTLAVTLDLLSGPDGVDPVATAATSPCAPAVDAGIDGLVIATAGGELATGLEPAVAGAVQDVASALRARGAIDLPQVGLARAAAMVITAVEGAEEHAETLRTAPESFDPRTRDRFLAGLGVPGIDYVRAQRFRRYWQRAVLSALDEIDLLVLPTVPCLAPVIDQPLIEIDGVSMPPGAILGRLTQPFSFIGLPAISVPVVRAGCLPVGVQLVAKPFDEAKLIAAAAWLESHGVVSGTTASDGEL
jgi:AtzE family amidohydrolase